MFHRLSFIIKHRACRWRRGPACSGSLFVDAACCLPVFILSVCLLISLINQANAEQASYTKMRSRAKIQVDAIAAAGLDIETDVLLQVDRPGNGVTTKLIYRPFIGESKSIADTEDYLVYVFPKRGERYHREGCSTMKAGDIEVILTQSVRRKYKACRICKPGSLPNGALVCIYSDASDVYHRRSCASITKSYETMTKSEAEKKGYTPCMLCIGGGSGS